MNNKNFFTLTIITCLTMLIASNLIAMDESRKRSRQDSDDNIEESQPFKRQDLEIECIMCRESVIELAPQQIARKEDDMLLGCKQGENAHYFHENCLNNWLTGIDQNHSQCPQCKQYLIIPPIDFNAIYDAIDSSNLTILQTLINSTNINAKNYNNRGNTVLHYAASQENQAVVEFLLTNGANPNLQNNHNTTPLHWAALHGNQAIVELLLANGANPESQDILKQTSLHYAAMKQHLEIAALLIANGSNPNLQDDNNRTALHYAVFVRNTKIVELLLANNANPNIENHDSRTALHYAATMVHQPIVELLLKHGANPNLQDTDRETALHLAAKKENQPIVELLLKHGANPNLQSISGDTALHITASREHLAIIELLLLHGANVSLINKKNQTPRQIATENGYQDIIDAINTGRSFPVYTQLRKQFPSTTITQANNTLTVNNITITFSCNTDRYNPFTDNNYHTIDIMVGDNTEPLKTYLTQALGSTTHRLGLLGTCWHLGTSNWQLTYRDASSWFKNYSSHSHIKPNTPLRFYLSAPDDADFKTYINFCVGLVTAAAGLTHE